MPTPIPPDEFSCFLAALKAEEAAAQRFFADNYGPRLRAFFLGLRISVEDAEDLAQDTLIRALSKLDRYEDRGALSFGSWLIAIGRNLCMSSLRKRHPSVPFDDQMATSHPADVSTLPPKVREALADALFKLAALDQDILRLRYSDGALSWSEIGKLTGNKAGTVSVRHHRACEKLFHILEKDPRTAAMAIRGTK